MRAEHAAVYGRPETRRATHGQGEVRLKSDGGPNQLMLQNHWMTCGWE